MKMVIAAVAILVSPVAATAQANFGITPIYGFAGSHETPTMKRQKFARAVALRTEAAQLLAQDGGTLTDEHQRYVQRKARDILSYQNGALR